MSDGSKFLITQSLLCGLLFSLQFAVYAAEEHRGGGREEGHMDANRGARSEGRSEGERMEGNRVNHGQWSAQNNRREIGNNHNFEGNRNFNKDREDWNANQNNRGNHFDQEYGSNNFYGASSYNGTFYYNNPNPYYNESYSSGNDSGDNTYFQYGN